MKAWRIRTAPAGPPVRLHLSPAFAPSLALKQLHPSLRPRAPRKRYGGSFKNSSVQWSLTETGSVAHLSPARSMRTASRVHIYYTIVVTVVSVGRNCGTVIVAPSRWQMRLMIAINPDAGRRIADGPRP